MKLQIALDYLMVFIFIVFIFLLVFVSIAKQRLVLSEQQTYSQLQLVSQTVASELSSAAQAGNGYTGTIILPQQLSVINYTISITHQGMVIATSNIIGQNIQATSFGLVQDVVSNSIYLSQNKQYYNIPTALGTGYLTLQNSFGTICIDYQCPSTSNQSAQLTAYDQVASTIQMNGFNNNAIFANPPSKSSTESISFWVMQPSISPSAQFIIDQGNFLANPQVLPNNNWIAIENGEIIAGPSLSGFCSSNLIMQPGVWYFVTYTVSSVLSIYINSNPALGCTQAVTPAAPNDIIIGESASGSPSTAFNGSIANLQVYNTSLTPVQIWNLYHEGISGSPIAPANIVAWYTFQGSGSDYSGNGRNLLVNGPAYYPSVAQIYSSVSNSSGSQLNNVTTGFITNLGSFSNGYSTSNNSDNNGIAYTFLNQGPMAGYANVKAIAFEGNSVTKGNVIGWWPMIDGEGFTLNDVSQFSNTQNSMNGNIINAYWALPSYVALFDGRTSMVQVPNAHSLQSASTISAWVNYTGPSAGPYDFAVSKSGAWELGACGSNLVVCYFNPTTQSATYSSTILTPGKWYFLTQIISGGSETTYVNAVKVLTGLGSAPINSNGIQIGYSSIGSIPTFFDGQIADIQVYPGSLSQFQISSLYADGIDGPPLYNSGILGWWPLNGNANDYSGSGNNGIIYGNLDMVSLGPQSTHGSQFLSPNFNDVNTYVSLGSASILTPNTNVIVSAWIKTASLATQTIFSTLSASSTNGYNLFVSGGFPQFAVDGCTVSASQSPVNDNQWHFIAATYNGLYSTIFIDGVQSGVQSCHVTQTAINYGGAGTAVGIIGGQNPFSVASGFTGSVYNVQLYNSTASTGTLTKLYQEGISGFPLQASGLAGWWPLNGDTNDYSTYGTSGTAPFGIEYYSQSTLESYLPPSLGGAGLNFANGLFANVIVPGNLMINGPFTVSAWINPSAISGNEVVIGKMNSFRLGLDFKGNNEGDFYADVGGSMVGPAATPFALNTGQWYMLTGVYDGTNIITYLNGVPVNTIASAGPVAPNNNPTIMGSTEIAPYSQYYYKGVISDVQVYNTALSAAQVYQLYNVGSPPSATLSIPLGGNT